MSESQKNKMSSDSTIENIEVIKQWFREVWGLKREKTIDEILAPDFIGHLEHETLHGLTEYKVFYKGLIKAIPDISVKVEDIVAECDRVVCRWLANGTHQSEYLGAEPSGKLIEFRGVAWFRLKEKRVVELWNSWSLGYIIHALLKEALSELKILRGILPLCSFCKKVRDDDGYWEQVDIYIKRHSQAEISHSVCPNCMKINYPEEYAEIFPKPPSGCRPTPDLSRR